jgi:methionine-gamma-lyase
MEDSKFKDYRELFCLGHGYATRALHAGEHVGQRLGGFKTPSHTNAIYQSSTFVFRDPQHGADLFSGARSGYIYTRLGNPTVIVAEAKLNALEGQEVKLRNPDLRVSAQLFSSGMAAISHTLMALLDKGDTMIAGNCLYGCTEDLLESHLPRFGINVVSVDTSRLDTFTRAMEANPPAKVVFFETPTNPTLRLTDIEAVVKVAKRVNPSAVVAVDNTFMTSYLQRPLELGAEIVCYSTTKYVCGHGTVVGGAVVTTLEDFHERLFGMVKDLGGSPGPFDAWLVNQGIKTLPLRMDRHCENAMRVAEFLAGHPQVAHVWYPGLETHPQHRLARRQMDGFGGIISFDLRGGYEAGVKLMESVSLFTLAVSLGCVDSLIEHPASMTHAVVPPEKRLEAGVTDGLVRLSVGIEDVEDLIEDLEKGLAKI